MWPTALIIACQWFPYKYYGSLIVDLILIVIASSVRTSLQLGVRASFLAALHLRRAEVQHGGQHWQQRCRLPGLVQLQDAAQQRATQRR